MNGRIAVVAVAAAGCRRVTVSIGVQTGTGGIIAVDQTVAIVVLAVRAVGFRACRQAAVARTRARVLRGIASTVATAARRLTGGAAATGQLLAIDHTVTVVVDAVVTQGSGFLRDGGAAIRGTVADRFAHAPAVSAHPVTTGAGGVSRTVRIETVDDGGDEGITVVVQPVGAQTGLGRRRLSAIRGTVAGTLERAAQTVTATGGQVAETVGIRAVDRPVTVVVQPVGAARLEGGRRTAIRRTRTDALPAVARTVSAADGETIRVVAIHGPVAVIVQSVGAQSRFRRRRRTAIQDACADVRGRTDTVRTDGISTDSGRDRASRIGAVDQAVAVVVETVGTEDRRLGDGRSAIEGTVADGFRRRIADIVPAARRATGRLPRNAIRIRAVRHPVAVVVDAVGAGSERCRFECRRRAAVGGTRAALGSDARSIPAGSSTGDVRETVGVGTIHERVTVVVEPVRARSGFTDRRRPAVRGTRAQLRRQTRAVRTDPRAVRGVDAIDVETVDDTVTVVVESVAAETARFRGRRAAVDAAGTDLRRHTETVTAHHADRIRMTVGIGAVDEQIAIIVQPVIARPGFRRRRRATVRRTGAQLRNVTGAVPARAAAQRIGSAVRIRAIDGPVAIVIHPVGARPGLGNRRTAILPAVARAFGSLARSIAAGTDERARTVRIRTVGRSVTVVVHPVQAVHAGGFMQGRRTAIRRTGAHVLSAFADAVSADGSRRRKHRTGPCDGQGNTSPPGVRERTNEDDETDHPAEASARKSASRHDTPPSKQDHEVGQVAEEIAVF